MSTQPTANAVPSETPRDLKFNAGKIDEFVTSRNFNYQDRLGQNHLTIEGIKNLADQAVAEFGWVLVDSFQDGATLTISNQALHWKKPDGDGEYYRWDGSFGSTGKVIPPGSTPASTGGIGKGAWIGIGDASLREYLFSSVIDYVTPEQFGAVSYDRRTVFGSNKNSASDIAAAVAAGTIVDSANAIQQAVNTGKSVVFRSGVYYTSKPIEQGYYTGDMLGFDVVQTAICKYTKTVDTIYGVDAIWVLGIGTNAYMRYKKIAGMSFARAKFDANSGTLQQPKAIENFFDYTDVNLIPYGYGLYAPKLDHFELSNVMIHGSDTNFYSADCWMSRFENVWAMGGNGYQIVTGTSITMIATWSIQASWNTYDSGGSLTKKYYPYDIGGVYHNLSSLACDYAGADGRPSESLYNFRQASNINISSLGAEHCHARYIATLIAGGGIYTTSFINLETISIDTFYNKYGDASLAGKRRVLFDVPDFCSLRIGSGKISTVYSDTTAAPQKPHIAYVGKKARLSFGSVYFFGDNIKGVQLNSVSYWTTVNTTTGVISPVAVTFSEVWVDSDTFQASAFDIRNGILDIQVAGSGSDIFWDNGSTTTIGAMAYRYGGYCAKVAGTDIAQFRVQNASRVASFLATNDQVGIYDYNLGQFILRHSQGTGDSFLTLGSRLSANTSYVSFITSAGGNAYDGRLYCTAGTAGTAGAGQVVLQSSLLYTTGKIAPFTTNTVSLGDATHLWTAVYATNGAIQTSDGRYKNDVASLTDSEMKVSKLCAKLYRTYKMKEGESGRTHIGVIVQDVIKAFETEGLDPFAYGVCCYDEWGESPAVYSEDGEEVIKEVKSGNRYALRYDEFNSFVNAGLNFWMEDIEARLASLEK